MEESDISPSLRRSMVVAEEQVKIESEISPPLRQGRRWRSKR
jgi:hypothetical protein